MGQCCNVPTEHLGTNGDAHKRNSPTTRSLKDDDGKLHKHHPLKEDQSSGSQSTPKENGKCEHYHYDNNNEQEYDDSEEELIDLSVFQEDVAEFIEFWHRHYGPLQRDYIYNALVKRIHNKVKEQYPTFPREAVDEFINSLPDLLETLEVLVNMAIDGDIEEAVSMYKQYQPILMSINVGGDRSTIYTGTGSTQFGPMPMPERDKKGKARHKQQDSISIKLTPAYIIDDNSKLPIPRTPSRSRTRSKSRSKSVSKSKSQRGNDTIPTDKDGIDLDIDDVADIKTQIVVTRAEEDTAHRGNSLIVSDVVNVVGQASPSPDPIADLDAYNLFMGMPNQHSFEEVEHAKMMQHSRTHSTVEERDSDDDDIDDPSVPLKDSTDDIVVDHANTESFGFDIETAEDAEIIMVGIMRTLWFDRIAKYMTKCALNEEIDDLFFLLSNALETAIGTFREYKQMMETFSLYTRQGLRTTLELIRAIINDLPLIRVSERTEEIYDDPYSILIHFADRCDVAVDFWNEHIATLPYDVKQQLSMRVYSYAVMNVPSQTYERLKQKGCMGRWSTLLLDFMESIIRFFARNRHQDLMEYLLILVSHHEKMQIPSTLLGNMGEWLDEVFATHFDEEIYSIECSDAIQFVYAFVGEVMSGAYEKPIYDTLRGADEFNNVADTADQINTEIQFPISFKSVVQIPTYDDAGDDDLTMNSDFTLQKPFQLGSLSTFNPRKYTGNPLGNKSVSFGPQIPSMPMPISNLDLESHPSLTDIVRVGPFAAVPQMEPSLAEERSPSDAEGPLTQLKRNSLGVNIQNLKPPDPNGSIYIGNSPLSRLESPTLSPHYNEPRLTPNTTSFDEEEISERAKTMHTALNRENEEKKENSGTPTMAKHYNTLNVVFKDELEKEKEKRAKKRSFSSVDNKNVIKYLAPNSQNNYTKSKSIKKRQYNSHRKQSSISNSSQSKTSSQMLLGKRYEKNWKPMHFLQKIMDLEGRKIISNYAFAPSDGSMSEKIVNLSIFHHYFETAQQFWSRFIDVNDRIRNKISDDLFNVFSERITNSVRSKIMVLFAQKQINFVQMFCLYFKLVQQYLDKCKAVMSNESKIPSVMTPSFQHKPHSGGKHHYIHKRTFSQRKSMSSGLTKFKLRSETTREQKGSNFHNEGQFFVREMLRMGTKHRSHNIEEKTLKLVAKCLIQVIEKQFGKTFNDKIKRAFTIALKLGIKFMCVEPEQKMKTNKLNTKIKSKPPTQPQPNAFRAKSAQVYSIGFVE